jgi:hypothetical protein
MLRWLITWLRTVLPPAWAILLFLTMYLVIQGVLIWVDESFPVLTSAVQDARDRLVVAGAIGYGLFRVLIFHPWTRSDYRRWLQATPWTPENTLPLGPIHLVPQDLVTVLLLTLLLDGGQLARPEAASAFMLVYLAALALACWQIGLSSGPYAVAFFLGLSVWLGKDSAVGLATLILAYPVAIVGLRKSMALFPWEAETRWRQLEWFFENSQHRKQRALGWPFDWLHPRPPEHTVGFLNSLALSSLAGWWVYVLTSTGVLKNGTLLLAGFIVVSVLLRLFIYCMNHGAPISVWGRILTFRWIIPHYDRVFIAPSVVFVLGVIGSDLPPGMQVPPEIVRAVAVSLVLFTALTAGPSLAKWRLTGYHRIRPANSKALDLIEF